LTADYEGFVWPDTGTVDMEMSAWAGEPIVFFTDSTPRPRPRMPGEFTRSRYWPEPEDGPSRRDRVRRAVASGRHALVAAPRHAAEQVGRSAVADWMRRAAAPGGRHALPPAVRATPFDMAATAVLPALRAARASIVAARTVPAGYLELPVTELPYRGRRRAEVVTEWRWPALAGSVAGASLAFAVLLAAASPPTRHDTAEPPAAGGGDGVVAMGNQQLSPAPGCYGAKHAAADDCGLVHKPSVITTTVYHKPPTAQTPAPAKPAAPVIPAPPAPAAQPPHVTQYPPYASMFPGGYLAIPSYGYGTSAYGTSAYGTSAYGTSAYGTSAYGTSAFGASRYGAFGYTPSSGGRHCLPGAGWGF
jgi:hypothetical protein